MSDYESKSLPPVGAALTDHELKALRICSKLGHSATPEVLLRLLDMVRRVPPAGGEVEVFKVQYRVSAGPQTGWSFWGEGSGDEFSNSYQVEVRELVDRANVTRLQAELAKADYTNKILMEQAAEFGDLLESLTAERDTLKAEVEKLRADNRSQAGSLKAFGAQVKTFSRTIRNRERHLEAAQSELTKARELLGSEFIAVRRDLLNTACNGYVQEQAHALNELREILAHQSAPAAKGGE